MAIVYSSAYERSRYEASAAVKNWKWNCDSSSAANGEFDKTNSGHDLGQVGSPALASTLWDSAETDGQGSRVFDGSSDYLTATSTTNIEDAAKGNWTLSAWIKPDDVVGTQAIFSVGGDWASETSAENVLITARLEGSELQVVWEHTGGVNVIAATTGASLVGGSTYFVVFCKEDDPDNAGKKRVRYYAYDKSDLDVGTLSPFEYTSSNLTNSDGGTSSYTLIAADGAATPTDYFDGTISDVRFDSYPLLRLAVDDMVAGYMQTWDEQALEDSQVYATYWKIFVKDSDDNWRDLSKLGDTDVEFNFLIDCEVSADIDAQAQEMSFKTARGFDAWSVAPLDEDSALNEDIALAYTDLLGVVREVWLKTCRCPKGYIPLDTQYKSAFHGFIDRWQGDPGGDTVTFFCRDRWAIVQDTFIRPESATVDQKVYGGVATDAEEVMQLIIDDNEPTYGYVGGVKPALYVPTVSGFAPLEYKQLLEPVGTALVAIADQPGFDMRYCRIDGGYTWRLAMLEPDRTTPAVHDTFNEDIWISIGPVTQSIEEYRNVVQVDFYDDGGTDQPNGDSERDTVTVSASVADLQRYGERFMRMAFMDLITTTTEATDLATAVLADVAVPDLALESTRAYLPQIQLNHYYTFGTSVWWSTTKSAAVRRYTHKFSADGSAVTMMNCDGTPKAKREGWLEYAVHPAAAPNFGRGELVTTNAPTCNVIDEGVNVSWTRVNRSLPANRNYDHTEVYSSTSTPVTINSTNYEGETQGTSFSLLGLTVGTLRYFRIAHCDAFGNRLSVTAECSATPRPGVLSSFRAKYAETQQVITGTTAVDLTYDQEDFDEGGVYDHTTYEFIATHNGTWDFNVGLYNSVYTAGGGSFFTVAFVLWSGSSWAAVPLSSATMFISSVGTREIRWNSVYLETGWKVKVRGVGDTSTSSITIPSNQDFVTHFSGQEILRG